MLNRNFLTSSENIYKKSTNIFSKRLTEKVTFALFRCHDFLRIKFIRLLPDFLHMMPDFLVFLFYKKFQSFEHLKLFRKRGLIQTFVIKIIHNIKNDPKCNRFIVGMFFLNQSE